MGRMLTTLLAYLRFACSPTHSASSSPGRCLSRPQIIVLKAEVAGLRQTVRRQGWVIMWAEVGLAAYVAKRLYDMWSKVRATHTGY